jgi:hypothetical protein
MRALLQPLLFFYAFLPSFGVSRITGYLKRLGYFSKIEDKCGFHRTLITSPDEHFFGQQQIAFQSPEAKKNYQSIAVLYCLFKHGNITG